MKRICILLAIALALACVPAMAAEGDAMLGRTEDETVYFSYCFTDGDTLYLTTYEGMLYSYRVGDADLTAYDCSGMTDDESNREYVLLPFIEGGRLYAICLISEVDENTEFIGAQLVALNINGDGAVTREPVCDVDWSDLVEYYDDSSYPNRPDAVIGMAGKAFFRYYDDSGANRMGSIDLESGAFEAVDALDNVFAYAVHGDGELLLELYDYASPNTAQLVIYNAREESVTRLCELTIEDYSPLQGLAYDAGSDTIYCVKAGEIRPVDPVKGEIGEGVTDMPGDVYGSACAACVLNGGYYAMCYEGAVIRNLDPAQKAQSKLKINDYSWNESITNAYYRFANAHGDISVVLSRDYAESEKLIENMMNRDDSIDIYVLSTSTAVFDALYRRGYLMELDGGAKVAAFAEAMYPALREALSTDGHLVALPVSVYGSTMGVSKEALKAMGLSVDDVPSDWPGFLDFLKGLEGETDENSPCRVFYSGYSAEDVRYTLFISLFEAYQYYVNASGGAISYNTPLLLGLLEKLDGLNYEALGCPTRQELDESMNSPDGYIEDYRPVLVQPGCGSVIGGIYGSDIEPILMRFDAEQPACLMLEATVAFVNPFTKNLDKAIAFMDEVVDNLTPQTRYNFDPSLTEPVRGKWNEQSIAEMQQVVDALREDLEKAEAVDRQMLEESIRDAENSLNDMLANSWEISPREVEWYRAHDDNLGIAPFNWLYDNNGDDGASGEAWTLISQYIDGQLDAQGLLSGIDRKVQMMLQEGN